MSLVLEKAFVTMELECANVFLDTRPQTGKGTMAHYQIVAFNPLTEWKIKSIKEASLGYF